MQEPCLIVRLSETTLKGRNRSTFEQRMANNIVAHLRPHGTYRLKRQLARFTVNGGADLRLAAEILRNLPGVANLSLAVPVPNEIDALSAATVDYVGRLLSARPAATKPLPFRVLVTRKHKGHPLRSQEVAVRLGADLLQAFPQLKVNLTQPELVVQVEIHRDHALLFEEKVPGPGGLAVGTGGSAVCLLSGGIDSPVAAHMMMTRGLRVVYLNFHSYPFIGEQSKEKVIELVRFLSRYQPRSRLYVAPFAAVQTAIRDACPEGLRTILYRRMMNRVANHIARRERAGALITGESVGQVASQTLPNIRAIEETAALPVLQPLCGLSKTEIIHRARHIGTYPISIQPFPDCCTLFQPRRPETRARLPLVERAEQNLPVDDLVADCLAGLEITDYGPDYYPADWSA
ncbi:MAG TPA: tRNA uracil 4-sulfurtransferase ThiI [bacterium]|nr:tRNA uracil 4-sulfurtransferase ThiI [bacterium]